jgi:CubicO group peptidase (beta-lactamase class C family)
VSEVVEDLESWLPERMEERRIPGVAVALVRDGRVVWEGGFGVRNTLTREPVTAQTVFELASISKVVSAYVALRLEEIGDLELDRPAALYLSDPYLESSEWHDAITVRQLLSHSSGLPHIALERDARFGPGTAFHYSAIGYGYLQAVIEEVTGVGLEAAAREWVFDPLEMHSASFVDSDAQQGPRSNGHVRTWLPIVGFLIPYGVGLAILLPLLALTARIRRGTWRLGRGTVLAAMGLVFLLGAVISAAVCGVVGIWGFWKLMLIGVVTFMAMVVLAAFVSSWLLQQAVQGRPRLSRAPAFAASAIVVGLVALWLPPLPLPRQTSEVASAPGSLSATAGDIARFLVELGEPTLLSSSLALDLRMSQVSLADEMSWGLGPGIQHGDVGDALWQWGQALDHQSFMIVYPEQNCGVVVCANSDLLDPFVAVDVAEHVLGGPYENVRRAMSLEFSHRP